MIKVALLVRTLNVEAESQIFNVVYLPQAPADLAFENFTIWILVYSTAHILMYIKPQRSLFHPFKLNPNYPPNSLILKEILRSGRGVGICTFYTVIVKKLYSSGMLPTKFVPSLFNHDGDVSWIQSFKSKPCENSLADFHTQTKILYWAKLVDSVTRLQLLADLVIPVNHLSRNLSPL